MQQWQQSQSTRCDVLTVLGVACGPSLNPVVRVRQEKGRPPNGARGTLCTPAPEGQPRTDGSGGGWTVMGYTHTHLLNGTRGTNRLMPQATMVTLATLVTPLVTLVTLSTLWYYRHCGIIDTVVSLATPGYPGESPSDQINCGVILGHSDSADIKHNMKRLTVCWAFSKTHRSTSPWGAARNRCLAT
eukprot:1161703-Pelagomonas_calceolata.AAC.6